MRLLTASELLVGNAARTLHEHVADLRYLVERIGIVERSAAELEAEHPELKRQPGTRWRKGQRVGIPEWLRDLAEELQRTLVDEISRRWHEVRCIERVWDEMTEQLDGADPAHPTARTQAAEARASLQALAAGLPKGEELLTEPSEETLASLRTYVREAYDLLGWTEVEPQKGGKR